MVTRTIPILLGLALLLGAAPGASAWHWEDEEENAYYGSRAGDPRTVEDAGECLDDVQDRYGLTCMVLYPHLIPGVDTVPVNAQRPMDCALGMDVTGGAAPVGPGWVHEGHTWYSAPSLVQYDTPEDEGPCEPGYHHPLRGLTRDLVLSPEYPIIGYAYLSSDTTRAPGLDPGPSGPKAGTMPCVTVEFTMQTGRHLGRGDVIAQGSTTKTVATVPDGIAPSSLPVEDPCPGSEGPIDPEQVTEFQVDLGTPQQEIPSSKGYIVHVRWYQWDGEDLEVTAQQNQWRLHSGPEDVNRVVVPVVRPLQVDHVKIQSFDDRFYILTEMSSPMGSYDVDAVNMHLKLLDDEGVEIPMEHLEPAIHRYSIDHDGLFRPVRVTFPWDVEQEGLEPGSYTIRAVATNWQHTDTATKQTTFSIPGQAETEDSPVSMLPALTLLALLALALLAARRRT